MLTHRSFIVKSRQGRLTLAGVLSAIFALLMTMAGTAAAAPPPSAGPKLGQGFMGVSYKMQEQPGKPSDGVITPASSAGGVQGIDVSHFQGSINWASVKAAGIQFAWIKATEGTTFKDDHFSANYLGAFNNGIVRGAYHFARPDVSGGAAQATFFASSGGAWSRDNLTLPGVLDIEGTCYGLSTTAMRTWISDFYNTYKARTTRDVVIYTSPSWWNTCTGGWSGMATKSPLWVAHWTTAENPTLPNGFPVQTVWQYTNVGRVGGISGNVDRDKFNGARDRLLALANNTA